jgi:hypothetical protein
MRARKLISKILPLDETGQDVIPQNCIPSNRTNKVEFLSNTILQKMNVSGIDVLNAHVSLWHKNDQLLQTLMKDSRIQETEL